VTPALTHGLDRLPRISVDDGSAPVALYGKSGLSLRFASHGRTPPGRGDVRMEVEVKRFDVPFDGTGTVVTGVYDTGAPAAPGAALSRSSSSWAVSWTARCTAGAGAWCPTIRSRSTRHGSRTPKTTPPSWTFAPDPNPLMSPTRACRTVRFG
jgi:hypothetical protein